MTIAPFDIIEITGPQGLNALPSAEEFLEGRAIGQEETRFE